MSRLILVYNADAGWESAVLDTLHKIFSPYTYACRLCGITYGLTKMSPVWKSFLDSLPMEKIILHRDEFEASDFYREVALPVILKEHNGHMETVVSAEDFEGLYTAEDLIRAVSGHV
jgi:hypothetical protein